ncbi:terminase small subunit [Companilactobacillus sp. RD055328]|uniref:terminase small subunit n=1 Tax=Companilactobacillus sp. RD055328 TaxID=2916634 RepID=UPI001FC8B943|nr:terminase small subunit [Companilactobacillus sp. RD055328]GKQ42924.1 terminase small subunit [Companilactobacillus sp. RD055328]
MNLTDKQKRFIDEYLVDLNATQAAIRAGYSKKTARNIGNENLTKPDIQTEIEKRMNEIKNKSILDVNQIAEELTNIAVGKPREVVSKQKDNLTGEVKKDTVYTIQPEDQDRLKALELLGKRYSMFTDKKEINATVTPVTIVDDIYGDEDG